MGGSGAGSRIRTRDPEITNHVLYQLSYTGAGDGFYQIGRTCPCPDLHFSILIPENQLNLSDNFENWLASVDSFACAGFLRPRNSVSRRLDSNVVPAN